MVECKSSASKKAFLWNRSCLSRVTFLMVAVVLSACSSTQHLAPTPNLYSMTSGYPASSVPSEKRSLEVDVVFVTDRDQIENEQGGLAYGDGRSDSMAAGTAQIRYGDDLSWETLVAISQSHDGVAEVPVQLVAIAEATRFPATPLPFSISPDGPVLDPKVNAEYRQSAEQLKDVIRRQLSYTQTKDIILYIHGFNNTFEQAVFGLNDIWHFAGRQGVPVTYSWPSGTASPLGYFVGRESGEFTIFHLKETLRIIAGMDEVENIHIVAHSRGTDVATTALRELVIESRAAGYDPRRKLKIENLIMAAPDLDYDVVKQRLIAEQFGPAFGQITIYMNEDDSALGLSQWLMKGMRFGRLMAGQEGSREKQIFQSVGNVSFINVKGVDGVVGHGYFLSHAGVLSDIIQLITTNAGPGSAERPLSHVESNFWSLDLDYLKSGS